MSKQFVRADYLLIRKINNKIITTTLITKFFTGTRVLVIQWYYDRSLIKYSLKQTLWRGFYLV